MTSSCMRMCMCVLGGSLQQYCDYDDSCAEFRTGYKCGECVDGMTDVGGQCVQCDSTNWAAASFLVIGALLFTVFVVFVDLDVHSPFFLQVPCVHAASVGLSRRLTSRLGVCVQVTFVTQVVPLVMSTASVGEIFRGTLLSLNLQWPSLLRSWADIANSRSCLTPLTPLQATGELYLVPIGFAVCTVFVASLHAVVVHRERLFGRCCRRCARPAAGQPDSPPADGPRPRFPITRCGCRLVELARCNVAALALSCWHDRCGTLTAIWGVVLLS